MLISLFYAVCDRICVLFFCPFQVWIMKNRCCVHCRIYRWDYVMMFTPLLFVPGPYSWSLLGLALILGGAIGNLVDRIRLGYVVDFIDFHIGGWHYPAFNVADSAITCGVILLLLDVLLVSLRSKKEA